MLIVIYTPDGYWIGADSKRSSGSRVCKVHETQFGLLLKGGSAHVMGEGSPKSTDKEVQDLLTASSSVEEFESRLGAQFKEDVEREIAYQTHAPRVTWNTLNAFHFENAIPIVLSTESNLTVVLFNPEFDQKSGLAFIVRPQSAPDPEAPGYYSYSALLFANWSKVSDFRRTLTGKDATGRVKTISFPASVRMLSYPVQYSRSDSWVQQHPKAALLEMLSKGHHEQKDVIGGPYTIVHVLTSSKKIKWIKFGSCPSWNEKSLRKAY
jgi:hypothetical protein